MECAHIIPPSWVDAFPSGTYQMALAHWVGSTERYTRFLQESTGYLLLDNGAFEGAQVSIRRLNQVAKDIRAVEVVLPDVPGQCKETLELSWKAFKEIQCDRLMFVPQGQTPDEWKKCLDSWLEVWKGREDYLSIGVSSLRDSEGVPIFGTKSETVPYAAKTGYPIHILGMTTPKYFTEELLPLALQVGVRGIDTSTAFALGAEGTLLTAEAPKMRLKSPEAYPNLSTYNRRLILLNRAILDYWVESGDPGVPATVIRKTASNWLKYWQEGFQQLKLTMSACGMPKGKYVYDGKYVRPLITGRASSDQETIEL